MKKRYSIYIALAVVTLLTVQLFSNGNGSGVNGNTLKSGGAGCSCHKSTATTTIKVVIAGPAALTPGQQGTYTATITGGSGSRVGIDIAASTGTLINADANLKVVSGELVQPAYKAGATYVFNFKYTAPATKGNVILYATGASGSNPPPWNHAANFTVSVNPTAVREDGQIISEFKLAQNYPNPFNPSTKIAYSLVTGGNVTLKVYDVSGKEVSSLVNQYQNAGDHSVTFDASKLNSGVYFYSISCGTFKETKKMVLMK